MIVIRTDSNMKIGMGHLMRCLSIAEVAKDKNISCHFIVSKDSIVPPIEQAGYSLDYLKTAFEETDEEIPQLITIVERLKPQLLIVDHYYVSNNYFEKIKAYVKIVYLDDLAVSDYPVDYLINYNLYGLDIDYPKIYKKTNIPHLFLGPSYAPMRKEFQNVEIKTQPQEVKNILISTGGADSQHVTLGLIHYLSQYPESVKTRKYHFIIGAMNPDKDQIYQLTKNIPNIVLHQNIKDMKTFMMSCDIAVAAAGSTLYELCACGIPTITYVLADNQISGAEAFSKRNIMISLGDCRGNSSFEAEIFERIESLCKNWSLRKEMSFRGKELVDGMGANRIIEQLKILTSSQDF